jgi:hypothetical protein
LLGTVLVAKDGRVGVVWSGGFIVRVELPTHGTAL